jgi:hypothetical protein
MPVKRRFRKARDDYPMPWEERPVSVERWQRHRERLMANSHPGTRPPEGWAYESPVPRPCVFDGPRECRVLYEIGELSEEEIEALMPEWRRHYEHSCEPHFAYCQGPGQWLEGPARGGRTIGWHPARVREALDGGTEPTGKDNPNTQETGSGNVSTPELPESRRYHGGAQGRARAREELQKISGKRVTARSRPRRFVLHSAPEQVRLRGRCS